MVSVTLEHGRVITLTDASEVASTAENYCITERTAEGPVIHVVGRTTPDGQRIKAWLDKE